MTLRLASLNWRLSLPKENNLERIAEMTDILWDTMNQQIQWLPEGTTKEVYEYCLIRLKQIIRALETEHASLQRWPKEGK